MARRSEISRRALLKGAVVAPHHISSAVVTVLPARAAEVREVLGGLAGVEVHASQASKIVITIEGASSGALGATLAQISLLDGVLAANMVFEQVDEGEV